MRTSANPLPASDPRREPAPGCLRPVRRAGAALALLAAAGAILPDATHAGAAGRSGPGPAPEVTVAERLLATIPAGSRIALRPLFPRETGLPEADGHRLYESVFGALFRAAEARPAGGERTRLVTRERLHRVYSSLEEFGQGDIASMLRAAKADVEVICDAFPTAGGVTLSCAAVDLETTVGVGHGVAHFPFERRTAPFPVALAAIAGQLAKEAPHAGTVEHVLLTESAIGASSDLSAYVGERLEGEVSREMRERARAESDRRRADAVLGTASAPGAPAPAYRLTGTIWSTGGESLWLEARLRIGRTAVAGAGASIARSSLPSDLLSPGGAGPSGRTYEAVAEAVVSARLDRASALHAARNLTRARIIAQALALPAPAVRDVAAEADGVNALGSLLGDGLTVEEHFREEEPPRGGAGRGEERVAVRLAARVVPVGTLVRPAVTASLDQAVYRAGDPIEIEVRGETAAHVGVFGWTADDRVVRLYPRGPGAGLFLRAGESVVLPRPEDRTVFRSGPLPAPGNREDHAAFVVVAAPGPSDFAALAPRAGRNVRESSRRAVDGSRFLTALAGQDPARMAVVFLPFQVYE